MPEVRAISMLNHDRNKCIERAWKKCKKAMYATSVKVGLKSDKYWIWVAKCLICNTWSILCVYVSEKQLGYAYRFVRSNICSSKHAFIVWPIIWTVDSCNQVRHWQDIGLRRHSVNCMWFKQAKIALDTFVSVVI